MHFLKAPEYAPDMLGISDNVTDKVINLFPTSNGYKPVCSPELLVKGLEGIDIIASFAGSSVEAGTIYVVADKANLYLYDQVIKQWRSIKNPDREYNSVDDAIWQFALFGKYLIAVHPYNVPQLLDLHKLDHFKDLGGNPPIARYVAVWENFLVLLNLADYPERIMWSGLNDIEFWKAGEKSCDYQDFPGSGSIQASSSSINPLIFTENAIYKAIFMPGSAYIFRFQRVYVSYSPLKAETISGRDGTYFFVAAKQLWEITEAGRLRQIGKDKVNETIFANEMNQFKLCVDYTSPKLFCLIKSRQQNIYEETLVYDWELGKFSSLAVGAQNFFSAQTPSLTLEELDNRYSSIDSMDISLDFIDAKNKAPVLHVLLEDNRIYSLTGAYLPAQLTTQIIKLHEEKKHFLSYITPVTDNKGWEAEIQIHSKRFSKQPQSKVEVKFAPNKYKYWVHRRGFEHRIMFKFAPKQNWHYFNGCHISLQDAGR